MATVQRLKGFIFLAFLYYTGLFGTIVIMGPTLILLCLRPRWFRWVNDHLTVWWLVLPPRKEKGFGSAPTTIIQQLALLKCFKFDIG
ncbi:hypothetical protein pdam_00006481 [Pocillopora damicornis]|uniref:Uncharacterized protein n=1 Tax=Pocillopora damicornis TaxID=46731 RepID=A0A3M6THK2_POCDA|nr:hypothetical protein pdam_00006481 [Pocillopora damicornis]